ncbi:MAG TPA: peptidoglycan-binding protein, partial [Rugosimonospora sp.]|nr:peptidoglycan-binding protein [Rugosimonospora sp.]
PAGEQPPGHGYRGRRRGVLWLLAGVAVTAGTVAGVAELRLSPRATPVADQNTTTVPVERTDLVDRVRVDGTLGYAGSYAVPARSGVVTWLPALGAVIGRGQPVYRSGNQWVPVFYGTMPLWRALESGLTGEDVRELQVNLNALGYHMPQDGHFGTGTSNAVHRWWRDHGRTDGSSTVAPGEVVIAPGPIRVSAISATLGLPATGIVLTATGTQRQITLPLPVDQQNLAVAGAQVTVELAGGVSTTGHIASVGTVANSATAASGGAQVGQAVQNATITVDITLDRPGVAGRLDAAPVTVGLTSAVRRGVLAVPVAALLANGGGTYAVAVLDAGGVRRRVPVSLGLFADGRVEVNGGGLAAGDRVEVPAG